MAGEVGGTPPHDEPLPPASESGGLLGRSLPTGREAPVRRGIHITANGCAVHRRQHGAQFLFGTEWNRRDQQTPQQQAQGNETSHSHIRSTAEQSKQNQSQPTPSNASGRDPEVCFARRQQTFQAGSLEFAVGHLVASQRTAELSVVRLCLRRGGERYHSTPRFPIGNSNCSPDSETTRTRDTVGGICRSKWCTGPIRSGPQNGSLSL